MEIKAQKELFNVLFDAHDQAKKPLKRCAIAFLLKNNCKVREDLEDPEKYQKHRKQKEIQIRRLEEQLQASIPKGRIIDNSEWLDVLSQTKTPLLTVEEFNAFLARLLQKLTHLPFPVFYETNTDLTWFKNEQGRICVKFNGLSQFIFEIACDRRQLHWFERFLSDYKTYQQHKTKVSTGLMPLRSAHLLWKEGKTKGEEWNVHHLHLHCAVDHRLWTTQGTETVKVEKIAKTQNLINSFQLKEQEAGLNSNQQQRLKANQPSLTLLQTFDGFSLSCRSNYQGKPEIFVGVSMGLENPATLAVVNIKTGEVLSYRSTKQLLSKIRRVRDKKPKPKKQGKGILTIIDKMINLWVICNVSVCR